MFEHFTRLYIRNSILFKQLYTLFFIQTYLVYLIKIVNLNWWKIAFFCLGFRCKNTQMGIIQRLAANLLKEHGSVTHFFK